jgi:protein-S-isoprenylcysteine O-methyltransferase Ste14
MRRTFAILGSAVFLVLAPGIVAGYVPWWICRWRFHFVAGWLRLPLQVAGGMLIAMGGFILLDSFARFALKGLGTPAPIFPTKHLVVTGWYRYVRNPMYVAVVSIICGQGLFFADVRVLAYAAAVWIAFHLFVIGYEEPVLRSSFGAEYESFCRNVRRWIPRLRPWTTSASGPPGSESSGRGAPG